MLKVEEIFVRNIETIINEGSDDFGQNVRGRYQSDGAPAHSYFITQVVEKYDIGAGELPITCLRPIAIKKAIGEILWIYQDASNDLDLLRDKYDITWWDNWDIGNRTIGQAYGAVVRNYQLVNKLLDGLKSNPFGRRHIINLYQYHDMAQPHGLDPCAYETIWSVRQVEDKPALDLTLIQRSSDYLVAGHINKMQYTALMIMVARHCGYELGNFCHFVQNLHIYDRHLDQAKELLDRYKEHLRFVEAVRSANPHLTKDQLLKNFKLEDVRLLQKPQLILNSEKTNFWDMQVNDFQLIGYFPLPPVDKFDLAI